MSSCSSSDDPIFIFNSAAFDFAQIVIDERFTYPGFQIYELFTKSGRKMRQALKTLRKTGMSIISERLAEKKAEEAGKSHVHEKRAIEKEGRDLLDLFMDIDLGELSRASMLAFSH